MPLLSGEIDNGINWSHIFRIWKETIIVFVVFLINRLVLLPRLFFKEKRIAYLITVGFTILIMSSFVFLLYQMPFKGKDFPMHPNYDLVKSMPVPPKRPVKDSNDSLRMPPNPPPGGRFPKPPPDMSHIDILLHKPNRKLPIPPYSNVFIMSLLIVGFDTGLVFFGQWAKAEKNKLKIEKENIETQMAFLKNQLSPHFFMNTLNNIHALVDIDSEEEMLGYGISVILLNIAMYVGLPVFGMLKLYQSKQK
jgi:hypothetical protein